MTQLFDIKRESELMSDGTHFWCEGCLHARPLDDRSMDPRYCQECFNCLTQEADILPAKSRKPFWRPKSAKLAVKKDAVVLQDGTHNLSTSKAQKIEVDKLKAVAHKVIREKPGPKQKALPVEKINQWVDEGKGSKAIASRLKGEGVEVSYKTIQRILNGTRLLI